MRFKHTVKKPKDFFLLHPLVVQIYSDLAWFALRNWGVYPSITSIIRRKSQDSGVHETGRALDVSRFEYSDTGKRLRAIPLDEVHKATAYINAKYPRGDGKDSILWHGGTGLHWHIQVAYDHTFSVQEYENKGYAQTMEGI